MDQIITGLMPEKRIDAEGFQGCSQDVASDLQSSMASTGVALGKPRDFTANRGYRVLLDLHREFGPFQSEALLALWNKSFADQIDGTRRILLESCLFALGAVLNSAGVRFDSRLNVDTSEEGRTAQPAPPIATDKRQLRYRARFLKQPTVLWRCVQDLMCAQFQSVYLLRRQEVEQNWIRVGPFVFQKTPSGRISHHQFRTFQELIQFIDLPVEHKEKAVSAACAESSGNLHRLEVVGTRTARDLRNFCGSLVEDSTARLANEMKVEVFGEPYSNKSIHIFAGKRAVSLSAHAINSRYIAGAGTALLKVFFDKETLSITAKLFGLYAKLENYNQVARASAASKPFLIQEFRNEERILAKIFGSVVSKPRGEQIEIIARLRHLYVEHGLTKAGLRFLKRISPIDSNLILSDYKAFSIVELLFSANRADDSPNDVLTNTMGFLSVLGEFCHHKPKARILRDLMGLYSRCLNLEGMGDMTWGENGFEPKQPPDPDLHFFRAIARHVLFGSDLVVNSQNLCKDGCDVVGKLPWARVRELIGERKITTERALRILHAGHEEMRELYPTDSPNVSWTPTLGRVELSGYTFSELCDRKALATEADLMRHCVDSYWESCFRGESKVFSGELNTSSAKRHRLTVSFSPREGAKTKWAIAQVRGFGNRGAKPAEQKAATALLRALCSAQSNSTLAP